VMTPQVARNALQVLSGDTRTPGTSAQQFQGLYNANPGISVAGKTGTVNATDPVHGTQLTTNADLWFAGVTPDLAATTALFNLDNPSKAISGIPGMTDDQAGHLNGEFAAQVWVNAMTQSIQGKQWAWPDPNQIANSAQVPSVVGQPFDAAKQTLTGAGFKVTKYPFDCGSTKNYGTVAFQSATNVAEAGSTITLCMSDGQPQPVYVPPKKTTPPKKPTKPPAGGTTPTGGLPGGPGRGRITPPPRH